MRNKHTDKLNVHAMLDGADTNFSRDFFVKKGKEGGKIGGKKSWGMLTDEEQKARIDNLISARGKLSTGKKKKVLPTKPPFVNIEEQES